MAENRELTLFPRPEAEAEATAGNRKQLVLSPMDRQPENPAIIVKIVTQDGQKSSFRMKRDTELIKLLLVFCERKEMSFSSIRFFYRGRRIRSKQTPRHLNMKDGAEIEAMAEQGGGGAPASRSY